MMKKVLFGAEQKGGYNNRWGWKNHQNLITEVAEINAEEGGGGGKIPLNLIEF